VWAVGNRAFKKPGFQQMHRSILIGFFKYEPCANLKKGGRGGVCLLIIGGGVFFYTPPPSVNKLFR